MLSETQRWDRFLAGIEFCRRMIRTGGALEHASAHNVSIGDLSAIDWRDVYRMAWVQSVGTLDDWLHQEIIGRAVEIIGDAAKPRPAKLRAYPVTFETSEAMRVQTPQSVMESLLTEQLSLRTLQTPKRIAEGLGLVLDKRHGKIWTEVAASLGGSWTSDLVQARQNSLVRRRNKIAHESDIDPATGLRRPITLQETDEAVQFIHEVGTGLRTVLI